MIAIFGTVKVAPSKAAVPKMAQCVDDFNKCGQRGCVLGLL